MNFHLPQQVEQNLRTVIENEPAIQRVLLFGSRARGDHTPRSDIDLALEGRSIPLHVNTRLRESAGLYKLDIVHLETLDNPELEKEVLQEGIVLFARQ